MKIHKHTPESSFTLYLCQGGHKNKSPELCEVVWGSADAHQYFINARPHKRPYIVVWKILQRSQEVLLGYIDHICGLGRSDRVLRRKLAEE